MPGFIAHHQVEGMQRALGDGDPHAGCGLVPVHRRFGGVLIGLLPHLAIRQRDGEALAGHLIGLQRRIVDHIRTPDHVTEAGRPGRRRRPRAHGGAGDGGRQRCRRAWHTRHALRRLGRLLQQLELRLRRRWQAQPGAHGLSGAVIAVQPLAIIGQPGAAGHAVDDILARIRQNRQRRQRRSRDQCRQNHLVHHIPPKAFEQRNH